MKFTSSEEYLDYLQDVLAQNDFSEYFRNHIPEALFVPPEERPEYIRPEDLLPSHYLESSDEKIELLKHFGWSESDSKSANAFVVYMCEKIKKRCLPGLRGSLERVPVGGFFRLYPAAMAFRHDNLCAILFSSGLLNLVYINICFLEAIDQPDSLLETNALEGQAINSENLKRAHNVFIGSVEEYMLIQPLQFRFNDSKRYVVCEHFEIIFAFLWFHEIAHINENKQELAKIHAAIENKRYSSLSVTTEYSADAIAFDLLLDGYMVNHEVKFSPVELTQLIEFYLFRLLNFCGLENDTHPKPLNRTFHLFFRLVDQGHIPASHLSDIKRQFFYEYEVSK